MRIAYVTLGCKVNQYDTSAMRFQLETLGHITVEPGEQRCDVVIINTCAVTGESERKSRQAIRRLRAQYPQAKLVVCGCAAQEDAATARELGADYVGGAGERMAVVEYVKGLENGVTSGFYSVREPRDPKTRTEFEALPAGSYYNRSRAYLKVQDGCGNKCTYCIIPYLRGDEPRSLPLDKVKEFTAWTVEQRCRELVLTGIELTEYGADIGSSFVEAVEAACEAQKAARGWSTFEGPVRVRLGSLEPTKITPEVVERLAKLDTLCPHFHLSLQSGSAEILRRMNRRYTPEDYLRVVKLLREYFDDPAITTDVIMGFPGETAENVQETLDFIAEVGFASAHVFPYSAREGTPAALMPHQLTHAEKKHRAHLAAAAAARTREQYLLRQVGRTLHIVAESTNSGYTENYCGLVLNSGEAARGDMVTVKVTGADASGLTGDMLERFTFPER